MSPRTLKTIHGMEKERDIALYKQFKKTWGENPDLPYEEVINKVLESPQPRMWMGFSKVYRTLLRLVRGEKKNEKWKSRKGFEEEVWAKYQRLKRQVIFREASIYLLASFIIAEPSRGFYLSWWRAYHIILNMRKVSAAKNRAYVRTH